MKNIVLLSDGTGNGAAKKNKTNVWRLYAALDLHEENQIAMYDDGVGSRESTLSKVMGGAFGYGLKQNVIELYKFLCRNYHFDVDAPQNNDKIYLFGFSRGAFTMRVLAGFVTSMGLCTEFETEQELHDFAVKSFTRHWKVARRGYLYRIVVGLKNLLFGRESKLQSNVYPDIDFIGVWDTVDAYGFPIDELSVLWDFFIYPIRFPDHQLSDKVSRACHAISVDDERYSFHPVMWDESKETSDRIEQVWFSGVHADVGGGYPRQSLSLVPLDWMLSKVEADDTSKGLKFIEDIRRQYHSQSDWNGPQHDSRSGLAMYYRYKPRNIAQICNDKVTGINIARPKIHRSVFERIRGRSVPYAPAGIPPEYQVVTTEGSIPEYETDEQRSKRSAAMNYALDMIYWRRWIYFFLLFTTLLLVTSRFFLEWDENGICAGSACFVDPLIQQAIEILPDFSAGWLEALRQNPKWLWGLLGLFVLLLTLRGLASQSIHRRATCAWAVLKGRDAARVPEWKQTCTALLRKASMTVYGPLIRWSSAIALFLFIVYLIVCAFNAVLFHYRYTTGGLCEHADSITTLSSSRSLSFDISDACFATGIRLTKGTTYIFNVADDALYDGDRYRADADGFSADRLIPFVPMRRHVDERWLKLFGRINRRGYETFPLGKGAIEYTARSDGELFLYVNDAVFGLLPKWDLAYHWQGGENRGRVTLSIRPK